MVQQDNILEVKKLNVTFQKEGHEHHILKDISFYLSRSQILGITGVSGSGKSVLALSILNLLEPNDMVINGEILFEKNDLNTSSSEELNNIRGNEISIIFQSPLAALNPIQKCGIQVEEAIKIHQNKENVVSLKERVVLLFKSCGLGETERIYNSYPHELSGGQLQRILIAMAVANKPKLIIADEATSSLDKKTTRDIINLLLAIKEEISCSIIFITHDLNLLKSISDKILVLENGGVKDFYSIKDLDFGSLSAFTQKYFKATFVNERPVGIIKNDKNSEPLIACDNLNKTYVKDRFLRFDNNDKKRALINVSLVVKKGMMLGILGESGSGKSTIAKVLVGLELPSSGDLFFDEIKYLSKSNYKNWNKNREIQLVFQDAFTSLNPKQCVGDSLLEIISYFKLARSKSDKELLILETLNNVGLTKHEIKKYPFQLSGGQRQRVSIAKVLLIKPKVIIFDESLSALDIFTQKKIMDLILDLNAGGLTCLFISHDPKLIKYLSDEILVLENGQVLYYGKITKALESNPTLSSVLGD